MLSFNSWLSLLGKMLLVLSLFPQLLLIHVQPNRYRRWLKMSTYLNSGINNIEILNWRQPVRYWLHMPQVTHEGVKRRNHGFLTYLSCRWSWYHEVAVQNEVMKNHIFTSTCAHTHTHRHTHTTECLEKKCCCTEMWCLQAESPEGLGDNMTYIVPTTLFCFNFIYYASASGTSYKTGIKA